MGPTGAQRSPIVVILLSIVTLGIYGVYWQYALFKEMKDHSGQGIGGVLGLVLGIVTGGLTTVFLLPHEVGGLYQRRGGEAPVSWLTGWWVLLPIVGGLVWLFKVQGRLNEYWASTPGA
ncbi:MAG: DUF4234 domain-containing protein [Acidimicrobiales bacterium]